MPWDYFCPNSCTMCGDMADGDEMDRQMKAFDDFCKGKILHCYCCETYFEFDTNKILDFNDIKDKSKIIKDIDRPY